MKERCDVLVIGGGGAALRAAIAAAEAAPGLETVLVTKGKLGHSGVTATACSDRMTFHATLPTTEPGGLDAWRYHADDIYRIGGYVSDWDLAQMLARGAGEAFDYLDRLGVPWQRRADGVPDQYVTDGSIYARGCSTGPYTAIDMERALLARARELPIRVLEGQMVAELLLDDARTQVRGAALVSEADGSISAIASPAVILATGGAGQVFGVSVFPKDCTGDGYALAYRAGAELVNLEFIQIGLCSLQTRLACSGDMMRALPRVVNDRGEEFLPRYISDRPLAELYNLLFAKGASWPVSYREPSHVIDIAAASEVAAGRRVFLDYGADPVGLDLAQLSEKVRGWYTKTKGVDLADPAQVGTPLARLQRINAPSVQWFADRKVDLVAGDRVEVAPAVQHFQGGVKIRTEANTRVRGLYAAGEVAGGQHGANRPGGNALMDTQVMGRVAGECAAAYARSQQGVAVVDETAAQPLVQTRLAPQGLSPAEVRREVGREMARACSVYRTQSGLQALVARLDALTKQGVRHEGDLAAALEAANVLLVARLVAGAALARGESRGPHLRFPEGGSLVPVAGDDGKPSPYIVQRAGADGPVLEWREPVRP